MAGNQLNLQQLIDNFLRAHQEHDDARKACEEAEARALDAEARRVQYKRWRKFKSYGELKGADPEYAAALADEVDNFGHHSVSHFPTLADGTLDTTSRELREYSNTIQTVETKYPLISKAKQTLKSHMGVDNIVEEDGGVFSIVKHISGATNLADAYPTIKIPRTEFTAVGLQKYRNHPALQGSPMWNSPPPASLSAVPAAVVPASVATTPSLPTAAKKSAAVVTETGESFLARFNNLHVGAKTAIVGGTALLGITLGSWAFKAKNEKSGDRQATGTPL